MKLTNNEKKITSNEPKKSGNKSFKEILKIVKSIREETIKLNRNKASDSEAKVNLNL